MLNAYYEQYDIFTIGAGYLDVQAALVSTDVASSTAEYVSNKGTVNLLYDHGVVWLKLPVAFRRYALHDRGGLSFAKTPAERVESRNSSAFSRMR